MHDTNDRLSQIRDLSKDVPWDDPEQMKAYVHAIRVLATLEGPAEGNEPPAPVVQTKTDYDLTDDDLVQALNLSLDAYVNEDKAQYDKLVVVLNRLEERLLASDVLIALNELLAWAETKVCGHKRTFRAGLYWSKCYDCGERRRDDEGGFALDKTPHQILNARKHSR